LKAKHCIGASEGVKTIQKPGEIILPVAQVMFVDRATPGRNKVKGSRSLT